MVRCGNECEFIFGILGMTTVSFVAKAKRDRVRFARDGEWSIPWFF